MALSESIGIYLESNECSNRESNNHAKIVSALQFKSENRHTTLEEIVELYKSANGIQVLLSGKTGSGKSTLINGLLGTEVARVSGAVGTKGTTTKVEEYTHTVKESVITVWDSPGLQDGTANEMEYLEDMAKKCTQRDLVLYCISTTQNHFIKDNNDIRAMKRLTEKFGYDFWTNAIIVLTFANMITESPNFKSLASKDKREERFKQWIQEWKDLIKEALLTEVGVPVKIINNLKVVPAGHQSERSLPDRDYWLSDLWMECFETIPTNEGQTALLTVSIDRLRSLDEVSELDFQDKSLQEQPLVIKTEMVNRFNKSSDFADKRSPGGLSIEEVQEESWAHHLCCCCCCYWGSSSS